MSYKTGIEWTEATWHTITAAKRIGVSVDEYIDRKRTGEKWCTRCKQWHKRAIFPSDRSRGDGLSASCKERATRQPVQLRLLAEQEKRESSAAALSKRFGLSCPKRFRSRGAFFAPTALRLGSATMALRHA